MRNLMFLPPDIAVEAVDLTVPAHRGPATARANGYLLLAGQRPLSVIYTDPNSGATLVEPYATVRGKYNMERSPAGTLSAENLIRETLRLPVIGLSPDEAVELARDALSTSGWKPNTELTPLMDAGAMQTYALNILSDPSAAAELLKPEAPATPDPANPPPPELDLSGQHVNPGLVEPVGIIEPVSNINDPTEEDIQS